MADDTSPGPIGHLGQGEERAESQDDIDAALVLGHALRNIHVFELAAHVVLATALGVPTPVAAAMSGAVGVGSTLRLIEAVAVDPPCKLPVGDVKAWLIQARLANTARNRIVHRALMSATPGGPVTLRVGKDLTPQQVTMTEVSDDGNLVGRAANAGLMLARSAAGAGDATGEAAYPGAG